jgi:hypothetical protein
MTSPWSNQRISLLILDASVTGFSGLFVYSPFPGAGNLIGSWAAAAGVDPYGNAYPAGLSVSGGAAIITGPDYIFNSAGLFIYSGTPAAGNLIASVAAVAGTDGFGNAYKSGFGTYGGGSFIQQAILAGLPALILHASGDTGDGTIQPLAAGGGYELVLTSPNAAADANATLLLVSKAGSGLANPAVVVPAGNTLQVVANAIVGAGLAVTGGETADTVAISSGQAGGLVLAVTNTTAAPAAPNVRITGAAAGDAALGIRIAGDAANRVLLDDNGTTGGRIRAGSGAAALDVALYRAAANQWAADYLAFNASGVAEVWQSVGGIGAAFANGWTNAGAPGAILQYRRNAAPYQTVSWAGRVVAPAGVVAGQAITAAVAAAYRPAHTQKVAAVDVTTGATVRLSIGSTGVLTYQSGAAAGDSIDLGDLVYLDA